LLRELGTNTEELESTLLSQWRSQLNNQLVKLEQPNAAFSDILDFVDNGVCPFIADFSVIIVLYMDLFEKVGFEEFLSINFNFRPPLISQLYQLKQ
jgi:hypothetical protein